MSGQTAATTFAALVHRDLAIKVVDIGANPIDGDPPYQAMLRNGHARVVGFEPNPAALEKLQQMKGPDDVYLPHAVGDGRRHTLHICAAPGMSSLLTPDPEILGLMHGFPVWGNVVSTRDVDTVRLDDVAEASDADLLKMDIQGAELMVLENAGKALSSALVIHTEVEFLPLYKDQPLYADIDQFLRSKRFQFHRFFPLVSRMIKPLSIGGDLYAGLSQSVWADAIFIPDLRRLGTLSDERLLKLAAILHDCYGSWDVVMHVLAIHDQRNQTRLAESYLAGLKGHTAGDNSKMAA